MLAIMPCPLRTRAQAVAYQTMAYDSRNRMTDLVIYSAAPAAIQTDEYEYDDTNNLTKRIINGSTTLYGYDDIDQLTSENRSGTTTTYTYDDNGNRLTKAVGGTTETYSYDDGDKLEDVSVGGTAVKTYGYDAAGRTTSVVTSAGTTTLAYDYEGRVSQITYPGSSTNTFTYNGLDTRVGKVDSAGTKAYRRDGDYVTAPVLGDGTSAFTPGISERKSSSTRMNHEDYLGAIVRQTGSAGTSQYGARYDGFGATYATSGTQWGPFGFAGQWGYQTDADSGLMLLGHRYYDSSIGRFLSRDPINDGRNWYTYCDNNPLTWVDEDGLDAKDVADHGNKFSEPPFKQDYINRHDKAWNNGKTREYTDCGVFAGECARKHDKDYPFSGTSIQRQYVQKSPLWKVIKITSDTKFERGDILWRKGERYGHTEVYLGDDRTAGASLGGHAPKQKNLGKFMYIFRPVNQ